MFENFTRHLCLAIGLLPAVVHSAAANDTLTVARRFYHVDAKSRLILVNQPLPSLTAAGTAPVTHVALDRVYQLLTPAAGLQTSASYPVEADGVRYTVFFTQVPVATITTHDSIVDTPSVFGRFTLTKPDGSTVQSNMGVEYRGAFSQTYPKKSFELSFWADTTGRESADVTLLGMRNDNKYNLQALYNEPLRMQSKVSNELWQEVHQIYYKIQEPEAKNGIASDYVEVFVNGSYQGIYMLTERIDRKQLKLKKYNNGITGELYKGSSWDGATTFRSLPPYDNTSETWGGFEYKHPEEQVDWSRLYGFVDFVENSSDKDFFGTYQQKFHVGNAVDYFIFLNLIRADDNTGKNLYIAKYKQGEPYYYVPWDLDGVFGNYWNGSNSGYMSDILSNGFYDRLLKDYSTTGFRAKVVSRWRELRKSVITDTHILQKFQTNSTYLLANNVYTREQMAWPDFTYDPGQLTYAADWLRNRLEFLDNTFNQSFAPITATHAPVAARLQLYPNPTTDVLTVETDGLAELDIRDLNGRTVLHAALPARSNQVDVRQLAKGVYVATVKTGASVATRKLVVN
ncbi:CotH kinase family protein [Hymenobacter pini]|uniref:CotH kinase family protein n=1 Tax=Hymenobacter pini TaxID=2880879 RepID=UPI001CF337C6|nr:CotH kinase family protein [Hymenobacter pini]MCA8832462.1 CotH kinase family protein [Hymenobacter pini]